MTTDPFPYTPIWDDLIAEVRVLGRVKVRDQEGAPDEQPDGDLDPAAAAGTEGAAGSGERPVGTEASVAATAEPAHKSGRGASENKRTTRSRKTSTVARSEPAT